MLELAKRQIDAIMQILFITYYHPDSYKQYWQTSYLFKPLGKSHTKWVTVLKKTHARGGKSRGGRPAQYWKRTLYKREYHDELDPSQETPHYLGIRYYRIVP